MRKISWFTINKGTETGNNATAWRENTNHDFYKLVFFSSIDLALVWSRNCFWHLQTLRSYSLFNWDQRSKFSLLPMRTLTNPLPSSGCICYSAQLPPWLSLYISVDYSWLTMTVNSSLQLLCSCLHNYGWLVTTPIQEYLEYLGLRPEFSTFRSSGTWSRKFLLIYFHIDSVRLLYR